MENTAWSWKPSYNWDKSKFDLLESWKYKIHKVHEYWHITHNISKTHRWVTIIISQTPVSTLQILDVSSMCCNRGEKPYLREEKSLLDIKQA